MTQDYELRQECWKCKGEGKTIVVRGDGTNNPVEVLEDPCTICDGLGYIVLGKLVRI
jgi:DnaJ-class molecular chaperone